MEVEEKDVNADSSTAVVEDQQPQEETVTQESVPENPHPEIEQQDVMPLPGLEDMDEVDEKGVPYKNRFHEVSRKLDKIQNEIPTLIQKAVQQASQPQYTRDDLDAFLASEHGQDPVNRKWAMDQLHEMTKKDLVETVRGELRAEQEKQQRVVRQQQAFKQAATLCPDAFVVQNGIPVGLNPKSQSATMIDSIMRSRPDIAQMPDGVAIAATMARGQIAAMEAQKNANKAKTLEAEKGALERSQMPSGGDSEVAFNAVNQAYERFKQTGSRKDYLAYAKAKRGE